MKKRFLPKFVMVVIFALAAAGCRDRKTELLEKASELTKSMNFTPDKVWGGSPDFVFLDGRLDGEPIKVRFRKTKGEWQVDSVAREGIWIDYGGFVDAEKTRKVRKTQDALLAWEDWMRENTDETGRFARADDFLNASGDPKRPRPLPDVGGNLPALDGWNRKLLFTLRSFPEGALKKSPESQRNACLYLTLFSRGADGVVKSDDDLEKNFLLQFAGGSKQVGIAGAEFLEISVP